MSMNATTARRVYYEGRVQGVGFRWTVRDLAAGFEVAGTVANLPDGRVELCLRGPAGEVDGLLQAIRESTVAGHIVREIAEEWTLPPGEKPPRGFRIVS